MDDWEKLRYELVRILRRMGAENPELLAEEVIVEARDRARIIAHVKYGTTEENKVDDIAKKVVRLLIEKLKHDQKHDYHLVAG